LLCQRSFEELQIALKKNRETRLNMIAPSRMPHGGSEVESLQRLGKILHLSSSRSLIVKIDEARFVKMGTRTCDSKLKEIGKVHDIFGPVSSPYVSIKPSGPSPAKHVGRIAYSLD
jgi:RNA-binding protein